MPHPTAVAHAFGSQPLLPWLGLVRFGETAVVFVSLTTRERHELRPVHPDRAAVVAARSDLTRFGGDVLACWNDGVLGVASGPPTAPTQVDIVWGVVGLGPDGGACCPSACGIDWLLLEVTPYR